MPPKVKVTKKEIVAAALSLVRQNGPEALCARSVAGALGCSTQPIFSNFTTMEELQNETIAAAYALYSDFLQREARSGNFPTYKAYGMAYIRFAKEEKELFKLLFMRDRRGEDLSPSPDFLASVELIMQAYGLSLDLAQKMHMELWACVHGIATMIATSFLVLDWDLIGSMISDVFQGLRLKYEKEAQA